MTASRLCALLAALLLALSLPAGTVLAQELPDPIPPSLVPPPLAQEADDIEVEVLTEDTQDPTALQVTPDGRVVWVERKGGVKVWLPDGTVVDAGRLGVGANDCPDCPDGDPREGGIHGLLLTEDFETSNRVYLTYTVPDSVGQEPMTPRHPDAGGPWEEEGIYRVSTFVLTGDNRLDLDSEEPIFETPLYWWECCHYGGDLDWMPDGTIVMPVGDDTNPFESSGYAPIDRREGREAFNALRTAGNPADRRGAVLRFNPDGSVPDDNPHVDDPAYDPYVYAKGFRSNYRISVNPVTGTVYVGDVGPDAGWPDPRRGPHGLEEIEVIPPGGGTDHGWPTCRGPKIPYRDHDFATGTSGDNFDCDGKVPAVVWYGGQYTPPWLAVGSGGTTPMLQDVYAYDGDGALQLPERFQDKVFFFEWSRNLVLTITQEADGSLDTNSLRLETQAANSPIDAAIGPDGALYIVEYGSGFWNANGSKLSRIRCAGCEPDPADYGLPADTVLAGSTADVRSSGVPSPALPTAPATAVVVLTAALALGLGLRRRILQEA